MARDREMRLTYSIIPAVLRPITCKSNGVSKRNKHVRKSKFGEGDGLSVKFVESEVQKVFWVA